jgi:membrane protein
MWNKSYTRLTRIITGSFGAGKEDLFSLEASLTRFERFVHFWVLVWQSFVRNRCPVRASALSYTTMLALIPMLAVAMSVSSVFLKSKGEEQIEHFIQGFVDNVIPAADEASTTPANETNLTNNLVGLSDTNTTPSAGIVAVARVKKNLAKEAAGYIHGFVAKTYSGTLGVTGMFFLVLTALLTLTRVEETFNDIWGVQRSRSLVRKVSDYLAMVVVTPIFLFVAAGLTTAGTVSYWVTMAIPPRSPCD